MTNEEAVENLRQLGLSFAEGIQAETGKDVNNDSPLTNGLVAYERFNLKGIWPLIDESVDVVVHTMHQDFIKKYEAKE